MSQIRFLRCVALFAVLSHSSAAEPRFISGVYPHLTTYADNGNLTGNLNECGIGAVVPWAGKLWMVNYAAHAPEGSDHKLYSIGDNLELTLHPESVGGTPAGRFIHRESNQLLIAHYLIDADGTIRVISPQVMPGRITAMARHLTDPANWIYYIDMEGMIYEANVHTLEVRKLFHKSVPGWHAKGAYTAQGRLIIANNGEHVSGSFRNRISKAEAEAILARIEAKSPDERGALATWDGTTWEVLERKQYTDVMGPGGLSGNRRDSDPAWSIGWDERALRLKLLDDGTWHTYLLPKSSFNNDAIHGWYTEWPRIREVAADRWMMDMHGMFFDFPPTFSAANTAGIAPIGSHLRYIPDFAMWNDRLVLATDDVEFVLETRTQRGPVLLHLQTDVVAFPILHDLGIDGASELVHHPHRHAILAPGTENGIERIELAAPSQHVFVVIEFRVNEEGFQTTHSSPQVYPAIAPTQSTALRHQAGVLHHLSFASQNPEKAPFGVGRALRPTPKTAL